MQLKRSDTEKRDREIQDKLINGKINISEAVGLSRKQLYAIARRGYQLMNSGKLEEARQIYAGLVAADPFDSVFHCHLGAILWRMGDIGNALEEYDASLRYNPANVDALAGRGELYLLKGRVKKGIEDLRKALENDPHAFRPSTVRARALLLSLHQAAAHGKVAA